MATTRAAEPDFANFEVGHACGNDAGYPKAAAEANATGTVRVRVTIDGTGLIRKADVLKSAGDTPAHKALDRATMDRLACPGLFKRTGERYEREIEYVWKLD